MQQQLSNCLNLKEQLKTVNEHLNFITISTDKNETNTIKHSKGKVVPNEKNKVLKGLFINALNNLNKKDLDEMKALKAYPSGIQMTGEACCLVFGKKAEMSSFVSLLKLDLVEKFKSLDINNISDYSIDQLKNYIENSDFNPDFIGKQSKGAAILCDIIIKYYNYAMSKKNSIILNSFCNYSTLKELIINESFYSFAWPCFYEKLQNDELKLSEMNSVIESKCSTLMPFINLQDFFILFDTDTDLSNLISNSYYSLPEKILQSNAAKVNQIS